MSKQQSFGSILDEIIKEGMEELIKNMMRDTITQEQVEALENNRTTEVIKGLNFSGVTLTSLSGKKFEDCFFKDCCFKEGHFIKAEFKCCNFKNCNFESADFGETNFKDCRFSDSILRYTIFKKANLYKINLYECNLFWANFLHAYLERVYFYGGSLECSGFLSSIGKNWEWLPGVVVPYNTNGKIRSERVQLLRIVEEE